jgi:ATP-dependent Lon protease
VIPRDNEADLDDLPAEVRDSITVSPVDTLAEALAITLRDVTLLGGRLIHGVVVGGERAVAH